MRKNLRIELGRIWLTAEDAAALDVGAEVDLDRPAEAPVSVFAGPRRVADGTLSTMDGGLAVRLESLSHDAPAPTGGGKEHREP